VVEAQLAQTLQDACDAEVVVHVPGTKEGREHKQQSELTSVLNCE
jgi:hypothetical protein